MPNSYSKTDRFQGLNTLDLNSHQWYTSVTPIRGVNRMPTAKKRINLSVDDDLYNEIEKLKEFKNAASLSAVVIELTKEAIEMHEDLYFARVAEERKSETTLPHSKIWKK